MFDIILGLRRKSSNFPPKIKLIPEICRDPEYQRPVSHPKQEIKTQELNRAECRKSEHCKR